ncbi:hypothetical protein GVAV_002730 [Gurleya vavrai]
MTVKASLTNLVVHKLKSNQSISSKIILDLFKYLETENPISILSFLLHIQEHIIKIENVEEKEFKNKIFILTEKIKELPQKLLCLYKNVNYELNEEKIVIEEFNLLKDIQIIILKCLLQHSSKEIENIIFSYFNPKKKMFKKINMVDSLLDKIYEMNNFIFIINGIKNLVLYIDQENVRKVLDYFIKNENKEPFYFKNIKNKDLFYHKENIKIES